MDTKEEILEEIEEIEDTATQNNNDTEIEQQVVMQETTADEITENSQETINNEIDDLDFEKEIQAEMEIYSKKNKTPLIVLLSILLVLDIAALVIYIIGIEKVISFIK